MADPGTRHVIHKAKDKKEAFRVSFGKRVVKWRHAIFLIALILLIPSVIGMKATRINYDMLSYLPGDMETVKGQDMLLDEFGKGGFSIIVVENMKTGEVADLKKKIENVESVDSVLNLEAVIDPTIPQSMWPEVVRDNFKNENASMLVVFFDTTTSAEPTINAVKEIRSITTENCYVSGMSALVTDLKDICETEEVKYVGIAVLLSLIAMMLLLDSYLVPFLFLASIGMAILYNLGSNVFLGEISYITKAIAAVLQLGVTMDYSIFLWHSFVEKTAQGKTREEAMAYAVDDTLAAVTGSSITTVAGFLALCFMSYTMGRDLGIVMAKGVVFGVIASVTILPAMILAFGRLLEKTSHRTLIPDAGKLAHGLTRRYAVYIILFVVLLVPAIYGYQHKNVVYDFTNMISSGAGKLDTSQTGFLTANNKLDEDFEIGTTHMIIADADLPSKDGRAMSKEIEEIPGVQNVLGIDALVPADIPKELLPEKVTEALVAGDHQLILVNSMYHVSTDECNEQIDKIAGVLAKYDRDAKLIGEGPATKDLITITDKDFKVVSFISMAAVFLIIFFVLRSAALPFILIAVIEFAIYMNLGIPGFTGLELPFIVPVCISTIQLGSTVDYAILMSTRYKSERLAGKEKREAVEIAAATSIPSIIVSAIGFIAATCGVGLYSNISIISTFCNLMARGALISMLTVILVLPSVFMAFDGLIVRSTLGMRKLNSKVEA
ncbi:MAG: MMPL family transporter [Eubacterium sp.]|nr:MMPL family transporter [Eubacterium sp.]